MDLVIPKDTLAAAHMTSDELQQEIAVWLFSQNKLTLVQASHLADMSILAFQHLLASREIGPHYDVEDFEEDIAMLREEGRI